MNTLSKEQISRFLAFTVGSKAQIVTIEYLNSIGLSANDTESLAFFQKSVLDIFTKEIESYPVTDGENIGVLLSG